MKAHILTILVMLGFAGIIVLFELFRALGIGILLVFVLAIIYGAIHAEINR